MVIYPENCKDDMDEFFRIFNLNPEERLELAPTEPNTSLPLSLEHSTTLRQCVQKYFDLTYIPKRYVSLSSLFSPAQELQASFINLQVFF